MNGIGLSGGLLLICNPTKAVLRPYITKAGIFIEGTIRGLDNKESNQFPIFVTTHIHTHWDFGSLWKEVGLRRIHG